jgi:hypothetical protein
MTAQPVHFDGPGGEKPQAPPMPEQTVPQNVSFCDTPAPRTVFERLDVT